MAVVLALPKLFDDVVARFTAEETAIVNLFGWREPAKKIVNPKGTAAKIAWVPGTPDGKLGVVGPAKYPGRNPRSIATLLENFYVEIQAVDVDPLLRENERAQYQIVRLAYDAWYRAIYLAAHGTVAVVDDYWMKSGQPERRFGAGIRAVCTIESMIPDEAQTDIGGTGAGADILVSELTVDEHVTVVVEEP